MGKKMKMLPGIQNWLNKKKIILILLLIIIPDTSLRAFPAVIDSSTGSQNLSENIEYFIDSNQELTINDISSGAYKWKSSKGKSLNFGFSNYSYWLKLSVDNRLENPLTWYLEINYPMLDLINLFIPDSSSGYIKKTTGDHFPFYQREIVDENFIFPVTTEPGLQTLYLQVKSTSSLNFSVIMRVQKAYLEKLHSDLPVLWIYYGLLIIMILYNMFIFFSTKEWSYIFCSLFIASWTLFQLTLNGFAFQYLWPDSIWWANNCLPFFITFCILWLTLFLLSYHDTKSLYPKLHKIAINAVIIPSILLSILTLLLEYSLSIRIVTFLALILPIFGYTSGIYLAIDGSRPARYSLTAFGLALIGVTLYVLKTFGIAPNNFLTRWGIQFGGASVAVLLSLGLADKINTMKNELQDLNLNLENKINDRTEELNAAIEEMEAMNENLIESNEELETAQKIMQMDMQMAVNVQENFLPKIAPENDKYDISFIFKPMADISGDFYDFYTYDNRILGISLFDVSGHGISSALLTMLAKSICHRIFTSNPDRDLNWIIEKINTELIKEISEVDNYMSGIMLKFNDDSIDYVNAGHTEMIYRNAQTGKVRIVSPQKNEFKGGFLGVPLMADSFNTLRFKIKTGDSLLLYSDCLNESTNDKGNQFGVEKILKSFSLVSGENSAESQLHDIINNFNSFTGNKKLSDDLTAIMIRKIS